MIEAAGPAVPGIDAVLPVVDGARPRDAPAPHAEQQDAVILEALDRHAGGQRPAHELARLAQAPPVPRSANRDSPLLSVPAAQDDTSPAVPPTDDGDAVPGDHEGARVVRVARAGAALLPVAAGLYQHAVAGASSVDGGLDRLPGTHVERPRLGSRRERQAEPITMLSVADRIRTLKYGPRRLMGPRRPRRRCAGARDRAGWRQHASRG
jgi:hypothetical protein